MTDNGNNNQKQAPGVYANVPPRGNETALMIEGLYNGLSYDLQKLKKELMNELKYNALQASSLYQSVQQETSSVTEAASQSSQSLVRELKYGYQQNQMIYESLSGILKEDVVSRLETIEGKTAMIEEIDKALSEVREKLDELTAVDYDALAETVKEKVLGSLPVQEEVDYDRIAETVSEKAEENSGKQEILDAVAAIPVPENVDYTRIVEEVSEKVVEKLRDGACEKAEEKSVEATVDYDRIIYGAAEKVVESLPYPEKVDYRRIDENFVKAAESIAEKMKETLVGECEEKETAPVIDEEAFAANVADEVVKAISDMDADAFAQSVAEKIIAEQRVAAEEQAAETENTETEEAVVEEETETFDYEKLSDMVAAKIPAPEEIDYDRLADAVAERMVAPEPEEIDYDKLADAVAARLASAIDYDKIAEMVAEKIPAPETIDYAVVAESVAERLPEPVPTETIDYDRVYQAAKAAEIIPDPVDYDRIAELVEDRLAGVFAGDDMDAFAAKVAEKVAVPDYDVLVDEEGRKEIAQGVAGSIVMDYETIADKVSEKVALAQPEPPTYDVVVDEDGAKAIAECVAAAIDFDAVSDRIAEKIAVPTPEIVLPQPEAVDYDAIADRVAEKIVVPAAEKSEMDYETLSSEVAEKISVPAFDVVVDDEGADKIATAVVEKMRGCCPIASEEKSDAEETVAEEINEASEEETEEAPAETEETVETEEVSEEQEETAAAEEPAAEEEVAAEETAEECEAEEEAATEEPIAEIAEETSAETDETETLPETIDPEAGEILSESESTIATEIAVSAAEAATYEEIDNNLVDADTGLVLRLKRSFTAKMKQSSPEVKDYYSRIKNELVSYKRINSNISWHGDRFNYGRLTVAKVNICGKTLCFYLALDPTDPEYKTTVYHQRDVSAQKAYENTPFMIKVKSDTGVKKALRLVGFLAEKLGTEKEEGFEAADYVAEFCHESTKKLLEDGLIKVTKEKKVVLDFD